MIPALYAPNGFVLEGFLTHCSFDYISRDIYTRTYMIILFAAGFILPLIIIFIFYTLIWKTISSIKNLTINLNNRLSTSNSGKIAKIRRCSKRYKDSNLILNNFISLISKKSAYISRLQRTEIKLLRAIAVIIVMFCFAWLPYVVVTLLAQFGSNIESYINQFTTNLPSIFAKTSSMYNPIIYILNQNKYRSLIRKKISFFKNLFIKNSELLNGKQLSKKLKTDDEMYDIVAEKKYSETKF